MKIIVSHNKDNKTVTIYDNMTLKTYDLTYAELQHSIYKNKKAIKGIIDGKILCQTSDFRQELYKVLQAMYIKAQLFKKDPTVLLNNVLVQYGLKSKKSFIQYPLIENRYFRVDELECIFDLVDASQNIRLYPIANTTELLMKLGKAARENQDYYKGCVLFNLAGLFESTPLVTTPGVQITHIGYFSYSDDKNNIYYVELSDNTAIMISTAARAKTKVGPSLCNINTDIIYQPLDKCLMQLKKGIIKKRNISMYTNYLRSITFCDLVIKPDDFVQIL